MSLDRLQHLQTRLRSELARTSSEHGARPTGLSHEVLRELVESMLLARHVDIAAHELRAEGRGHYTICSSGHEANVVLGRLAQPDDQLLVHYRSAALQIERARRVPGVDAVRDIVLSLVAARDEPTSRGRHKVFGHPKLGIIPQTSTIASHLPRALGLAFATEQRRRLLGAQTPAASALVIASFGDASVNHSTALGAFNAASWTAHQRLPLPLLFVCEDNGLGISVRTPEGWIRQRLTSLPHVRYFHARSWDIADCYEVAAEALDYCRTKRAPAVLHLECVRLLGHAGSDADAAYRSTAELQEAEDKDPVRLALLHALAAGALSPSAAAKLDESAAERVRAAQATAKRSVQLSTREEVMSDIALPIDERVSAEASRAIATSKPGLHTLAQALNASLQEALGKYPEALLFGEDVAKKGGVYGITKGLLAAYGPSRVFNTLLDEQTILGLALGTATAGLLPIPEIQYLAYLHNAEDQLRGEAATMRFFSAGAYDNPMVVRIAGLAYQKGFGGHFHNDNAVAVLRDIPGLILAVPARADDAVALVRSALALARAARRVVVVLEPIALYHQRDLYEPGDGLWQAELPARAAEFGRARVYGEQHSDLLIVTYGNGLWLSLRAARRLEQQGVRARVLDLRWLCPLPEADIVLHAAQIGRVLVVDECRRSAGPSEAIAAALLDADVRARWARVTSADSFVPLGEAAQLVLVSEQEIVAAALRLVRDA